MEESPNARKLRGHKVMRDADLAALYEVPTKVLLQAVKRNLERFPSDFMFQLEKPEVAILRSQFVTSSWGGRRTALYAFTEQGVAMLSTVLRRLSRDHRDDGTACASRVDALRRTRAPRESQ